jgi:uncharacterized ubiquitin-like protein YukD
MVKIETYAEPVDDLLTVNIQIPGGMVWNNTKIEADFKTEEIIGQIINRAGFLSINDADLKPITYSLINLKNGYTLREGESLREAGVRSGDTLGLFSSVPVAAPTGIPSLPFVPKPDEKEVKVYLKVLDSPKAVSCHLPLDVKVEDLIARIVKEHKVSKRDKFGERGKLELASVAKAVILATNQTLREAGVMHEDTLELLETATAGGRP